MGFDDLARHMASRDGQQVAAPTDANDFIRRAAEENRRIDRRNDLILGSILLVGGLIVAALSLLISLDSSEGTSNFRFRAILMAAGAAGVIDGGRRLVRGLRS